MSLTRSTRVYPDQSKFNLTNPNLNRVLKNEVELSLNLVFRVRGHSGLSLC